MAQQEILIASGLADGVLAKRPDIGDTYSGLIKNDPNLTREENKSRRAYAEEGIASLALAHMLAGNEIASHPNGNGHNGAASTETEVTNEVVYDATQQQV